MAPFNNKEDWKNAKFNLSADSFLSFFVVGKEGNRSYGFSIYVSGAIQFLTADTKNTYHKVSSSF